MAVDSGMREFLLQLSDEIQQGNFESDIRGKCIPRIILTKNDFDQNDQLYIDAVVFWYCLSFSITINPCFRQFFSICLAVSFVTLAPFMVSIRICSSQSRTFCSSLGSSTSPLIRGRRWATIWMRSFRRKSVGASRK